MRPCRRFCALFPFLFFLLLTLPAQAQQVTERCSLDSLGVEGNQNSYSVAVSGDGRFVAYTSHATNLVPNDTNGVWDIFVHDRRQRMTNRVSVDNGGIEGNLWSEKPCISHTGQFIAFQSASTNLVPGDTNNCWDVFVHDQQSGTMQRASINSLGAEANWDCVLPAISGDGTWIAFESQASNLVPGDTNQMIDIFVHDRLALLTTRVSVSTGGGQANGDSQEAAISADGRFVAFRSAANNLVPGDTNGAWDIFVHEMALGVTTRVSVDSVGLQANGFSDRPTLNLDGSFVGFESSANNLVAGDTNGVRDIFVHDRLTGMTTLVSRNSAGTQGNMGSYWCCLSANGQWITFDGMSSNLVPGDTNAVPDVFLRDLVSGITTRVSVDSWGAEGNGWSEGSSLSADARFTAFESSATNLDLADTNSAMDAFLHGPELTLAAVPPVVTLGANLELSTWLGMPSNLAMLFVVQVDGTVFVQRLLTFKLDPVGAWIFNTTMPNIPSLSGHDLTLQTYTFGAVHGMLEASNLELLKIL